MTASPVSKVPPIPAGVAALCGLLGALPVAFFAVFVGLLSLGYEDWRGAVLGAIPAAVFVVVLVGVVLLLAGRSWKVLVVGALATLALVLVAVVDGAAEDDLGSIVTLAAGPVLAAVFASLAPVRAWVAARRAPRG
ncbi:MAG: hypothetical protein F2825_10935 [Actinobacteria bacterium]|jgi:hypothetical protein|uniref:Uncharacterized protein n=2 Tax=root TaxID=1 RepID=A0ABU8E246_9ACTN|nr:hypothetical protein [Klenkia terrae]MSW65385.1 hypothetical protein [Actinomycetota bacterium]SSC21656.1 Hypothetical protein KLENKIAIHU_230 [Klenkia terrae]